MDVHTTEPEMDVHGITKGHEYQFRVKAVNEEGESEPLETEHGTIARNPYGMYEYSNLILY